MRRPEVTVGGRSSNGTPFLLTVMPARSRRSSPSAPVRAVAERSTSRRWLSVPPLTSVEAAVEQLGRQRPAVRHDLLLAGLELGRERVRQRDGLARDDVHERPALEAREDGAVDRGRQLLGAHHDARPGAAEGLVRRRRHQVGDAHRRGVHAGRDQARDVGHVDHQQRAHLVGDLAEGREVDDPRDRRTRRPRSARGAARAPCRAPGPCRCGSPRGGRRSAGTRRGPRRS